MDEGAVAGIAGWIHRQGLNGASESELLDGFCERCRAAGIPLDRSLMIIDTLHPTYEGRAFRWSCDGSIIEPVTEYRPTTAGADGGSWQRSVFYHLLTTGTDDIRRRFRLGDPADFPGMPEFAADGYADYVAMVHRFSDAGTIGEMDCFYSHWLSRDEAGFSDAHLSALRHLVPSLALATKCTSLARIAGTLVEVYLGQDAGHRVLSGRMSRGVAERINAGLWFSDLRGYTRISDAAAPDEIIPLLNDYAEAVITSVQEASGTVLKLIGDGVLAIFKQDDPSEACLAALAAEEALRARLAALAEARSAAGRPVTEVYLGLHVGEVFYGNIGSDDRLDFTVVGPAVNEVSRIAAMCRSVDRPVVMSSDFARLTPRPACDRLVSVGRYALRGVGRAQELFTLDPALRTEVSPVPAEPGR